MTAGVIALASALVVSTLVGLALTRRTGRIRSTDTGPRLDAVDLDADLGPRATLVQFSTVFCAPCRATRRILDEVAALVDGVTHVEIDAESHLDLVRRFDIRRTPTVLVLDHDGHVVKRASGLPRKADVVAALDFLA